MSGAPRTRTLWQLVRPGSRLARAILVPQWDRTTLTFWAGNDMHGTAPYADESAARDAARLVEGERVASGWRPLCDA